MAHKAKVALALFFCFSNSFAFDKRVCYTLAQGTAVFMARGELLGRIFVYIIELVKTIKIYGGIIMKRTALIVIALAFALTGCASMEGEKETSPIPTETIVSTDNAPAQTIGTDNGTAEDITKIFDVLNTLEYQPYTCDGLPEYLLTAPDGTVYSINLSEKWIWRENSEQAELSDKLIARLKEDKNLTQAENVPVETKTAYTYEELSEMPAEELLDLFIQNGLVINDDLKKAYTEEEIQALFKEHFDMWHIGLSALNYTVYIDLAEQTKAIYDKIAE